MWPAGGRGTGARCWSPADGTVAGPHVRGRRGIVRAAPTLRSAKSTCAHQSDAARAQIAAQLRSGPARCPCVYGNRYEDPWTIEDEELSRPFGPPMPDGVRSGAGLMVRSCVSARARAMTRVITGMFDVALAREGVKVTHLLLLATLADRGGTSLRDLCVQLGTLETTTSRSLGILVRRGWVERHPAPKPRWCWFALTTAGARVLARALPIWREVNRAAVAFVEREIDALGRVARRAVRRRSRRLLSHRDLRARWRDRARYLSRCRNERLRAHRRPGAWPAPRSPP